MFIKRVEYIIVLLLIITSCTDPKVSPTDIARLEYQTIEKAKEYDTQPIVIVTQGRRDYVFVKEENGKVVLIRSYVSHSDSIYMHPLLIWMIAIILLALFIWMD